MVAYPVVSGELLMRNMEAHSGKDDWRQPKADNLSAQPATELTSYTPASFDLQSQRPVSDRQHSVIHAQQTRGNQAVRRMLAESDAGIDKNARRPPVTIVDTPTASGGLSRVVVDESGAETDLMRPTSTGSMAVAQRDDTTTPATGGTGATPAQTAVTFPTIGQITADATVEAERAADWTAGETDFKERAGWVMWNRTSSAFSVTGKVTGTEDGVNPGATPADSGDLFMVGHYHQHPQLSPGRDKSRFPVGPSGADTRFANARNSPGVVRDFTDTARTTVTNYTYGPNRRA
jgi:hypothetical protein